MAEETSSKSASLPVSNNIPIEIVSEEEMAFIEAALSAAATRSSSSPIAVVFASSCSRSQYHKDIKTLNPCRSERTSPTSCSDGPSAPDIEDSGDLVGTQKTQSLLHRFRSKRGLSVTDITATEWCEKQMQFILLSGKRQVTTAMKAGSARHAQLEKEVITRANIPIQSVEEAWALKLMNFVVGANQLLFEGLTREIPVLGMVEGVWMTGVIDEMRMSMTGAIRNPSLIDTKTRSQAKLPSEAQKRNARLQLMCYKYLWDSIVEDNFPLSYFFEFFGLNPHYVLSGDIQKYIASSGFHAEEMELKLKEQTWTASNIKSNLSCVKTGEEDPKYTSYKPIDLNNFLEIG